MKKIHLFTLLLAVSAQLSCAASFDCAKAGTTTEKLICSNAKVSALDEQLATLYKTASDTATDKDTFKSQQRDWLKKKRNVCTDAECLTQAYQVRINELTTAPIQTAAVPIISSSAPSGDVKTIDEKSASPNQKPLTFKLVFGNSYPICQPYIDMLNAAKYTGFSELACERKILPQFPQFKAVNWAEITDKNEMEKILEERMKIKSAPLSNPNSYIRAFNEIVKLIRNSETKMYFFKDDLDKDGSEDIGYKIVQIDPSADEATDCKKFSVNYFDDKKTTVENAKQRYPGPYYAFSMAANDELFYFKDSLYSSYWGVITAGSNIDIYAVGNKKICGILAN
ncbi:MAG: lysozyme inhibitor LprI family protein [Pseudomonadota bacterium]